jgi:hypothetical protein
MFVPPSRRMMCVRHLRWMATDQICDDLRTRTTDAHSTQVVALSVLYKGDDHPHQSITTCILSYFG